MTEHRAGGRALMIMPDVFIKRPGMFMGSPIRFDRVTAFIAGYTFAIDQVREALSPDYADSFHPPGVEGQFQEQLREQGRLRWNRWDLTIAAEAIGWNEDEPPVIEGFTDEQHRAAIAHLEPLLERMFSLPAPFRLSQRDGA